MTYPPPGPPPPYGYPPPPPPRPARRISVGMAFAGSGVYFVINFFVGFIAVGVAAEATGNTNAVLIGAAVMLALLAFGGGSALLAAQSPYAKGLGLGLMIGWAVTSMVTFGFCTGLNPEMYG